MAAILGGTMRSPLTGVVFALELTHDVNALLPLLIAVVAGPRLHRAGDEALDPDREGRPPRLSHLSREYAIDPLEILFVREVMRTNVVALPASAAPADLARSLRATDQDTRERRGQHLYPVVDDAGALRGVVTRRDLHGALQIGESAPVLGADGTTPTPAELIKANPVVAYPDEPLRAIVNRMAETGLTQFPVVERTDSSDSSA